MLRMAPVVYRIPAVRDEAPPQKVVDHIMVERAGRPPFGLLAVAAVALASVLSHEFPATRLALFLVALVVAGLFALLRGSQDAVVIALDSGAKTISWGDVSIPFTEIAYPQFDGSTRELVLVKKDEAERVVIVRGLPDPCSAAHSRIVRALMAEYESFRDMPPTLAALARQIDAARSAKEKNEALDKVLRTIPLDGVTVTEQAGVITAHGNRGDLHVEVRYLRSKERPEIVVQRRTSAKSHIEVLRGSFSTNQSGLVERAHRIYVNGAANAAVLERRREHARILHDMERLDLRHVYLWPTEVKIVPYATFLEARDPDIRVAAWIALAVACAEDVA